MNDRIDNPRAHPHGFATRAIHAGQEPDPTTGAVMTPIYATSTYAQTEPGRAQGLRLRAHAESDAHARSSAAWPISKAARAALRSPRGWRRSATLLELLDTGAHVVASDDLYGGTYRLFERVRKRSAGLEFTLRRHDRSRARSKRRSGPNTRMLWVETPTNPLLKLVDLAAVAQICPRSTI